MLHNVYVLKYRFLLLNTIKMSYLVKFFYRFFFLKREKLLFSSFSRKLKIKIFLIIAYVYVLFFFCHDISDDTFFFFTSFFKLLKIPVLGYIVFCFFKLLSRQFDYNLVLLKNNQQLFFYLSLVIYYFFFDNFKIVNFTIRKYRKMRTPVLRSPFVHKKFFDFFLKEYFNFFLTTLNFKSIKNILIFFKKFNFNNMPKYSKDIFFFKKRVFLF